MAPPDDASRPTVNVTRTVPAAATRLEVLLDELIEQARGQATIDEEDEPTLKYGPGFAAIARSGVTLPPARPSGTIEVTQPLTAMPSRVAVRPVDVPPKTPPKVQIAGLLERAVGALLARDYATVSAALTEVLRLDPEHAQARANMARLRYLGVA